MIEQIHTHTHIHVHQPAGQLHLHYPKALPVHGNGVLGGVGEVAEQIAIVRIAVCIEYVY